jgi:hypothetical protein
MTKNFIIAALIAASMAFAGCKPSYPKDNVPASIEKLLRQEYNVEGHAKLVGETVYMQVDLVGLVSTEQEALTAILKKVQGASLVVTRVALSSDANIKNLVLVVSEPTYRLNLRIIQRVEDVKSYLYMKISRADYEERLILEIEHNEGKPDTIDNEIEKNKDLSIKEFAGRLIISQINMLSRSNPFLGVMLGNTQLKYVDFDGEELVASISHKISKPVMPFFEDIINAQALKIRKKNICAGPKRVKLIDSDNISTYIEIRPRPPKAKTKPEFYPRLWHPAKKNFKIPSNKSY